MQTTITFNPNGTVSFGFGKGNKGSTRPEKGESLLISTLDFVSIDIETTGFSSIFDEIIELGAAKYRNGKIVDTFSSLVHPHNPVDDFITGLTGISNEMLEEAPELSSILPAFLDFIGNDVLVGHNVNFDINFIYDACEEIGLSPLSNDFIDTVRISRRIHKDMPNHKLDTMIDFYGFERRALHRSLNDCELTAMCYLKMVENKAVFEDAVKNTSKKRNKVAYSLKNIEATTENINVDSLFYGKVCVFTGTLESFTRKEAAQLVVNIGGLCEDRITKKTNFLILGNNDYCKSIKDGKSNKQKKAEQLIADGADLMIIPESLFVEMLHSELESIDDVGFKEENVDTTEQTDDSELPNTSNDEQELYAFNLIVPKLKEYLIGENITRDCILLRRGKTQNTQYSSVCLLNESNLLFRLCFRGRQSYFSISSQHEKKIPDTMQFRKLKSDPNFCRIDIPSADAIVEYSDLMCSILHEQLNSFPTEFGCCSRYIECSDERKCIHPDLNMALGCAYRKNLQKGKVFYGKNKNI